MRRIDIGESRVSGEFLRELIVPNNSDSKLDTIYAEVGGLYDLSINITELTGGNITVATKRFKGDTYTTKQTISATGIYDIVLDPDTDIHLHISSDDVFTALAGEVQLKKKIDSSVNGELYQGVWDASTDTPTLPTASVDNQGYWYRCTVAGTYNGDVYAVGDKVVSNGLVWEYDPGTDYELGDYVKLDGSTPFTAPQKGVDGVDDDDLAVIQQVALRMLKVADSDLDMDGFDIDMGNGDISNIGELSSNGIIYSKIGIGGFSHGRFQISNDHRITLRGETTGGTNSTPIITAGDITEFYEYGRRFIFKGWDGTDHETLLELNANSVNIYNKQIKKVADGVDSTDGVNKGQVILKEDGVGIAGSFTTVDGKTVSYSDDGQITGII